MKILLLFLLMFPIKVFSQIEELKTKGVISVGSHYGEEYERWIKEGFQYFIFIEPVSSNFKVLQKHIPESDKIKLFNIALGNMTGEIKMNIEEANQGKSSSILTPENQLKTNSNIKFDQEEIVQIDKLDNIDYDRSLYDFLHLYAQGYELEVLKGAEQSLYFIKTIEIEVFKQEQYKGCTLYTYIIDYLEEREFKLKKIDWYGDWGIANFEKPY